MKKLTKLIPLLVLSSSVLCACNITQPGKISVIAGTYQLETYEVTRYYKDGKDMEAIPEEERVTVNMIEEYEIVHYVVISESGMGYYYYKDKDTPEYCYEVKQTYTYSTDDDGNPTDLIGQIQLDNGVLEGQWTLYVQAKRKTLTNNSSAWRGQINIGKSSFAIGNKDKVSYKYKKVNKAQNLKYVTRKTGYNGNGTKYVEWTSIIPE